MGRTRDETDQVTGTVRSLFLTRDLRVQSSRETRYDAGTGGFHVPRWDADTYLGGLGIGADELASWAASGSKVLDLGAGLALFATEAIALDIEVDCADLEYDEGHPTFAVAKDAVATRYPEQMTFLRCLSKHSRQERYLMDESTLDLLDLLYGSRHHVAADYPKPSGRRFRGDATTLEQVADGSYAAVLCPWLLAHLEGDAEKRVVETCVRVTRGGGQVRLRAGLGENLAEQFRSWYGLGPEQSQCTLLGKRVAISRSSVNDLLVLHVLD